MKELNTVLNILMGTFFGEIYEATNSAPWYYGAADTLMLFLSVVILCVIIKLIVRKRMK